MKIIDCSSTTKEQDTGNNPSKDICHRHIMAFGEETQTRISQLHIGIAGLGGLGMIAVEQIMRLFPASISVVDKDQVELTNLNRLTGATTIDATLETPKAILAARHVLNFNPEQEVHMTEGDILEREIQLKLRHCDVIFSCFDRVAPRLAINQLCQAHGILLFDLGTGAMVESDKLAAAGGQVIRVKPSGGFCLSCIDLFDKKEAAVEFMSPEEAEQQENLGYVRGANIVAPQVYALNGIVASNAIWMFMCEMSDDTPETDGIYVDAVTMNTSPWKEEVHEPNDCPICGENGIAFTGDAADLLVRGAKRTISLKEFLSNANQQLFEFSNENQETTESEETIERREEKPLEVQSKSSDESS